MTRHVLLVDDDAMVREALAQSLDLAGLVPVPAASFIEAKDHVRPDFEGVVLSDIRMPGKDGFALLEYVRSIDEDLPVILLTGEGDIPMAVRGIAEGAFDFLEKPCETSALLDVIQKAMKTRSLVLENRRLKRQAEAGDAAERLLAGSSALAGELRARARAAARGQGEVLICGEPGAGISKVAEVVHLLSASAQRPFVKRAGAALDAAGVARAMDEAGLGTLFIDEAGGMPPGAQFALLELLDQPGGARVIAGSTRDLEAEAQSGAFNPDLFYRLDLMRIRIPSLRERKEDIPDLFRHYVGLACEQAALPQPEISQEHLSRLMAQEWPGNARALMNAAMRFAMGLGEGEESARDLGLAEQMARVERSLLIDALRRHEGRATEAARALKLPRKTFYDKLARHGIRAEDFRL